MTGGRTRGRKNTSSRSPAGRHCSAGRPEAGKASRCWSTRSATSAVDTARRTRRCSCGARSQSSSARSFRTRGRCIDALAGGTTDRFTCGRSPRARRSGSRTCRPRTTSTRTRARSTSSALRSAPPSEWPTDHSGPSRPCAWETWSPRCKGRQGSRERILLDENEASSFVLVGQQLWLALRIGF